MIKRPLHPRFSQLVLDGEKTTTIREKPWPIGVPIMLYKWSGAAYRSKQTNVAAVMVEGCHPIKIAHDQKMGMRYSIHSLGCEALFSTEGFASRAEMDAWFLPHVKPGQSVTKHLMRFRLADDQTNPTR